GEHGGGKVEGGCRGGGGGAGRGDSGPADDQGNADASLVDPPLAAPERKVGGGRPLGGGEAAVVGREDDQCVLRESELVQSRKNATRRLIHGFDHGGEHRKRLAVADLPGAAGPVILDLGSELVLEAEFL